MSDMVREMLISHDPNETRVALLEDSELVELYIERPKRSVAGNVYLAQVTDVLPGMQAAFVDIGLEKNAFLHIDDIVQPAGTSTKEIASLVKVGQQIMVQVTKDPMGTKGARVTTDISLPGRFLVLMPFSNFVGVSKRLPDDERQRLFDLVTEHAPDGLGVIARTVAQGASERELASDFEFLIRLWKRVQHQATEALAPEIIYTEMDVALRSVRDIFSAEFRRLIVDDKPTFEKVVSFLKRSSPELVKRTQLYKERQPLFDFFGLGETIDGALKRTVGLKSGGSLVFDKTEAMTVVDVNTGHFVGKRSLEDTIVQTNLEAADEIGRQLRLRDIGGIIIVDFIDMEEPANRELLTNRLSHVLDRDRTKTRMSEISRLGLIEISRKNVTEGLYGVLTESCPTCAGEGRVISVQTRRVAVERQLREILRTRQSDAYLFGLDPDTYELITAPGLNVAASLRAETGKQVTIVPDEGCGPTEVRVLIEGEGRSGLFQRKGSHK